MNEDNVGTQAAHDARACTSYAGVDLTRHPALDEAYRIACLIEACGASPELTRASRAAFDFVAGLDKCLRRLEAERDAWKLMAQGRGKLLQLHGIIESN